MLYEVITFFYNSYSIFNKTIGVQTAKFEGLKDSGIPVMRFHHDAEQIAFFYLFSVLILYRFYLRLHFNDLTSTVSNNFDSKRLSTTLFV